MGDLSRAKRDLNATIAEATKYQIVPVQLEARLALGQVELKSNAQTAGVSDLRAVEQESKSRGFLLIGRKAAAAMRARS